MLKRKIIRKIIISAISVSLLSLLLVLSACGGASSEGNVIRLGAALSLTGKYTTSGEHTKNGYDLAVKRINENGGIEVDGEKYTFEIIYYDDESTPARAAQLAERLIKQDKVDFMLGPYSSGLTKAIAPITERYKIPMVEANGASRSLSTKGYRYLFIVLTSADQYLESSVDFLVENAQKNGKSIEDLKIALAFENDPFSQDVKLGVVEKAKQHGIEIAIDDNLPKTLDDMTSTLNKVKAINPDLLVVSGHAKGAATAARQIEELKVDVDMMAMTHCDSAGIQEKIPVGAEYTLCALQWQKELTYQDDDGLFGNGLDYARIFQEEFGYEPPYQAAESSAAVQIFADAFIRANSFDKEVVRDALSATEMQTFYGNIKFDETGKNIAKPMVLSQIIDSEYIVVSPSDWAQAPVVYPKPKWSER